MKFLVSDENRKSAGIYKITSNFTGKIYIGSSKNFYHRFHTHKYTLLHQLHHSKSMQLEFDETKFKTFVFEIIELCDESELLSREQYYLDKYNSANSEVGFNNSPTAGSSLNVVRTQEHKDKVSLGLKRYFQDPVNLRKHKENMKKFDSRKIALECQNRPEVKEKLRIQKLGSKNIGAKLNETQVIEIKKLLANKSLQQKDIAVMFNISRGVISQINKGHLWSHVATNYPKFSVIYSTTHSLINSISSS